MDDVTYSELEWRAAVEIEKIHWAIECSENTYYGEVDSLLGQLEKGIVTRKEVANYIVELVIKHFL